MQNQVYGDLSDALALQCDRMQQCNTTANEIEIDMQNCTHKRIECGMQIFITGYNFLRDRRSSEQQTAGC